MLLALMTNGPALANLSEHELEALRGACSPAASKIGRFGSNPATLTMQPACEPVSALNSLLTGKITGNFPESGRPIAIFGSDQRADSITYSRIPYATEQGIFKCVSGNFFQETGKSH